MRGCEGRRWMAIDDHHNGDPDIKSSEIHLLANI